MTVRRELDFGALLTQDAVLERPVAVKPYQTFTKFRLEAGKIKLSRDAGRGASVTPSRGVLEEFVSLADAPDEKYLTYAGNWGLLDLCEQHHAPTSHNHDCKPLVPTRTHVFTTTAKAAKDNREQLFSAGEPISAWRSYAKFARALLNIAARLHQGEVGSDEDWRTLHSDRCGFLGWDYATERRKAEVFPDLERERSLIAEGVNYWLVLGDVRPRISWSHSRPIIEFECSKPYGKLFAVLAIQLMMAITQLDSLAICSACGQSYMPKRRPKSTQRRYCMDCKSLAQRDASADYRRRQGVKRQPA